MSKPTRRPIKVLEARIFTKPADTEPTSSSAEDLEYIEAIERLESEGGITNGH